ncbi:MAG: hypothetical protein GFH27_549297n169 [Chloroflexi bacterium AL-W]|nr:hypothetical protein [Chloroflexi bacterium AL-N1]NOK68977.1 hypothetical protein [Chloroflexi bacterium AL-N10]NOK76960.1 hypothetical protein [Chloroflexi bacterium AL-N5]NOK82652.1 hypothetical protein [Chloroflexi bacterium AL-W]NOK90817.1 hypothetical protein [Chloroflexi bacterium AL-N15]
MTALSVVGTEQHAYATGIILNEFLANPGELYEQEWVELYNETSNTVDLAGWKLDDGDGGGSPYTMPFGTTIDSKAYLMIYLPGALLNNGGDSVRLIRPDGLVIDETSYDTSTADISRSRSTDGSWYDSTTSPGGANIPANTQSVDDVAEVSEEYLSAVNERNTSVDQMQVSILINEFLPAPGDVFNAEWIEVINTGDVAIDIGGWSIDDGASGGAPYTLPSDSIVPAHGLLTFTLSYALFNNGGDEIRLIDANGVVVDTFSYTESIRDISYCRYPENVWVQGCNPSPGEANRPLVSIGAVGDDAFVVDAESAPVVLRELDGVSSPDLPRPTPRMPLSVFGQLPGSAPYIMATPGTLYTGPTQDDPAVDIVPSPTKPVELSVSAAMPTPEQQSSNVLVDILALGCVCFGIAMGVTYYRKVQPDPDVADD